MIHPWQKDLLDKMTKYKGRGLVQITGRNAGKSVAQAYQRLFDDIYHAPLTDLKLSTGTVYGARYYTVQPVGGDWLEMETWCYKTFGKDDKPIWGEKTAPEPAQRWYMNNRKFWFRDEKDQLMFVMKWR